jgi:hypothetical protein
MLGKTTLTIMIDDESFFSIDNESDIMLGTDCKEYNKEAYLLLKEAVRMFEEENYGGIIE